MGLLSWLSRPSQPPAKPIETGGGPSYVTEMPIDNNHPMYTPAMAGWTAKDLDPKTVQDAVAAKHDPHIAADIPPGEDPYWHPLKRDRLWPEEQLKIGDEGAYSEIGRYQVGVDPKATPPRVDRPRRSPSSWWFERPFDQRIPHRLTGRVYSAATLVNDYTQNSGGMRPIHKSLLTFRVEPAPPDFGSVTTQDVGTPGKPGALHEGVGTIQTPNVMHRTNNGSYRLG